MSEQERADAEEARHRQVVAATAQMVALVEKHAAALGPYARQPPGTS